MLESDKNINILVFTKSNKSTDIVYRTNDDTLHHFEYYGDAWKESGDIYYELHSMTPFLNGLKSGNYVIFDAGELGYVSGIGSNLIDIINVRTLEEIKISRTHIRGIVNCSTKSFLNDNGVRSFDNDFVHKLIKKQYNHNWDVNLYKSKDNKHTDLYIKKSSTIWWGKLDKHIRKSLSMKYFTIIEDINHVTDLEKLIIYCKESEVKSSYFYKPLKNLTLYVLSSNISEIGLSEDKTFVMADSYGFPEFNIHNNHEHEPLQFVLVSDTVKIGDIYYFDTRTNNMSNDSSLIDGSNKSVKAIKATFPQVFDDCPVLKESFVKLFIDSPHKNIYELEINEHFIDEYCIKIETKIVNLNRKEIYNLN